MASGRVIFQNWIVELGKDPDQQVDFSNENSNIKGENESEKKRQELIKNRVAEALKILTDDEREFIERFYFMGMTYLQISEKSGRAVHKLEALHQRAVRRLRKELKKTVEELWGIKSKTKKECPLCQSASRVQIDKIINSKQPSDTWKEVIKQIHEQYGIKITTPQLIIGHKKYH